MLNHKSDNLLIPNAINPKLPHNFLFFLPPSKQIFMECLLGIENGVKKTTGNVLENEDKLRGTEEQRILSSE